MARSKKEVSNIVSGAGLLTRIFTDLDKQVRELGGTDEDWHRLTTPNGAEIIRTMAEAIVGPPPGRIRGEWLRTRNVRRTITEMIEAGNYRYVDDVVGMLVREEGEEEERAASGHVDFQAVLIDSLGLETPEVTDRLRMRGLRPARIEELLAFGEGMDETLREEFMHSTIVALGSSIPGPTLTQRYPSLVTRTKYHESELMALTAWPGVPWSEPTLFLAVRRHTDGTAARHLQEIEQAQ